MSASARDNFTYSSGGVLYSNKIRTPLPEQVMSMASDFEIAICESEDLAKLLRAVIQQFLKDAGIPPVNDTFEQVFGRSSIGEQTTTTQMLFFIGDLAAFTPELISRIRTQVIPQFKKWTVVPQYGEQKIAISAKGISFGNVKGALSKDLEKDYQLWLQGARDYDEKWKGPLRRQFRYLAPLISAAMPTVNREQAAVLSAFDAFVPPIWGGGPVVWVLTKGGRLAPRKSSGEGALLTHTVNEEGSIEPSYTGKYWPTTDKLSPFFLQAHEFSWNSRSNLELVLRGWKDEVPDTAVGPLRVDHLILDADLKVRTRQS